MAIACLGWGSLIWCQKALPVSGEWRTDGPPLPIEFARESRDKRITLVVCEGSPTIKTLWIALDVQSLAEAKKVLAAREGIPSRNVQDDIGFWTPTTASNGIGAKAIADWATPRDLKGVVWTALKPKFGNEYRKPSQQEVIDHLAKLENVERKNAEEYIRLAPRQVTTLYRSAIEEALGWTPKGLI
jgi:hypothetical protein